MAKPVLVDTSVWIAYFRKDRRTFEEVNTLADARRICLAGLVLAELYQGCKSLKEIKTVHDLAEIFPRLDEPPGMWEEAGMLAYNLRRQGQTIGLADCYVAVIARNSGTLIYSYDKHFAELAKSYDVGLYSLRTANANLM